MGLISTSTNLIVRIGLISFTIASIVTIGSVISAQIPWVYFGYLFALLRFFLEIFDFIIDIDTLIFLLGLTFFIEGVIWSARGVMWVVNFFNRN